MPKGAGKSKTSMVKFHGKGKWSKAASTDGQSSRNPKIPDGLIMITGFTEEGVDESKSNFIRFKEVLETYTKKHYSDLAKSVAKPFGPEFEVPIPDPIRKKKSHAEVLQATAPASVTTKKKSKGQSKPVEENDDEAGSHAPDEEKQENFIGPAERPTVMDMLDEPSREIYRTELLKAYMRDCRELEEQKNQLASDLWAVTPKVLQEHLNYLSQQEISIKELEEEERGNLKWDRELFEDKNSKNNFYWLWPAINQVMSLGVSKNERPSDIRLDAKNALMEIRMLPHESLTDYEVRFRGAH